MYKELIQSLTFTYTLIARGRGKLDPFQLKSLQAGAITQTEVAPLILDTENKADKNDQCDLAEAQLINEHIEEMLTFQLSAEII